MTPQKVIDEYEAYVSLRKFVERYESMTDEERDAQPKVDVEVDWTENEIEAYTTAAERAGLTLDRFVEVAIYEYMKKELKELAAKVSIPFDVERAVESVKKRPPIDFSVED